MLCGILDHLTPRPIPFHRLILLVLIRLVILLVSTYSSHTHQKHISVSRDGVAEMVLEVLLDL